MDLTDGVFYQSSNDNALVAVTADYPGLVPASQVTEAEVPALRKGIRPCIFLIAAYQRCFAGEDLEAEYRARGG